jgi:predicted nucleic acid-binding protein
LIAYLDTSAVVPLLVEEPASALATELWDAADRAIGVRLVYPEARAALAKARRMDRLTAPQLRTAVRGLHAIIEQMDMLEIDEQLALDAGALAESRQLRGYDAVHLAAALRAQNADLVLVAGDRALLDAAAAEGLATAPLL